MRKKQLIILVALAVVFFFVYSYLNFQILLSPPLLKGEMEGDLIFNSPDETAGYFFSKLFAETGRLSQLESFDFLAPYLIHPRSVYVQNGYLAPGSFLGLPLVFGSLARIAGIWTIPFFTPFFAVLGVIAFYFLLRKIWDENTAFLSAVLMFFLPSFWYYSTRTMFSNILFVSLLIITASFLFAVPFKSPNHTEQNTEQHGRFWEYVRYIGGGLFFGLALITRTSEIVWLGILGLALVIYFVRKIHWPAAIFGFAVLCAAFVPVFWQNQAIYGSSLKFGYNVAAILSQGAGPVVTDAQNPPSKLDIIGNCLRTVFPFGIHPRAVWQNFWNYFIKFFWWFTTPMILGCLIFLYNLFKRRVLENEIIYFLSFIFISGWLLIYYGSWQISDNINFQKITIGNSYLRYWLPVFVMGLPFIVIFLKKLLSFFKTKSAEAVTLASILIFVFSMSAMSVFAGEDEGIFYVKNNLLRYNEIRSEVLDLVPSGSIIITERSDKIFFPARRVIIWKRGEALGENFKNLSKFASLYYYNVAFTNEELKIMNQELSKLDLRLELIKIFGNEGLYKIK
jgi:asparagine N-glycosylation enzyme membrane subunit Stt3